MCSSGTASKHCRSRDTPPNAVVLDVMLGASMAWRFVVGCAISLSYKAKIACFRLCGARYALREEER
jgi:hypothetical protein